ncbi:MAG: hypothetical protein JWP12_3426 [Bacteroidetes bacterium]|nr:hypothetical protein [Bacteroidota bacterium]
MRKFCCKYVEMSKKQISKKPAKKAVKPLKKAVSSKKAKPAKAVKVSKPKKAEKPSKKVVAKKAAKKVVSKKPIIKKAAASAKKVVKKAAKPSVVKKVSKKPVVKKAVKKVVKKVAPAKKSSAKKVIAKKTIKPVKVVKAPAKPLAKAPEKAKKNAKEKEPEKPVKAAAKPIKAVEVKGPKPEKVKPPRRSKKGKKSKDDEDEPSIENDPLIEEIIRSTKKKQSQPKKPKIIQTFVNPMASLAVAVPEGKKPAIPKKEPKGKFELEYVVRTSAGILYEFLTSPSGLSEWFADDVNIRDGIFTFYWDGSEQKARLLSFKDEKYVRMQWMDKPEGTYFEFRIDKDELTGDTSLIIIDFADEGSDLETSRLLWDSQVNKLLHVIGSY